MSQGLIVVEAQRLLQGRFVECLDDALCLNIQSADGQQVGIVESVGLQIVGIASLARQFQSLADIDLCRVEVVDIVLAVDVLHQFQPQLGVVLRGQTLLHRRQLLVLLGYGRRLCRQCAVQS